MFVLGQAHRTRVLSPPVLKAVEFPDRFLLDLARHPEQIARGSQRTRTPDRA
jgi:hypothetical protein